MITHVKRNLPMLPRGLFLHHAFQLGISMHFTGSSMSLNLQESLGFLWFLQSLYGSLERGAGCWHAWCNCDNFSLSGLFQYKQRNKQQQQNPPRQNTNRKKTPKTTILQKIAGGKKDWGPSSGYLQLRLQWKIIKLVTLMASWLQFSEMKVYVSM